MAEIAYAVRGLRGSLATSLAFARRLRACGHRVTFLGFRDLDADITGSGFDWVRLQDGPRLREVLDEHRGRHGTVRSIPLALRLRAEMIRSREVVDTLSALDPELLICDDEMHGVIIASRPLGVPTLLTTPWFDPFRTRGLPPLHTGLRPPTTRRERLAVELAWQRLLVARALSHSVGRLDPRAIRRRLVPFQLNSPSITDVRALARRHRVPLRGLASARHWVDPLMYPSLPHLSMTAYEMDAPHTPPPQLEYAGPMIDAARHEPLVTATTRTEWERFRVAMAGDGRAIVYASMGSLQPGNAAWYRRIIDGVAGQRDLALVVGLGGQGEVGDLGVLPENVLALGYAPQLDILRHAAAAVHHGGIGTINECVYQRVPSVVTSSGFTDENGNAARIAHHRLGVEVSPAELSGPGLLATIRGIIGDPAIASSLATMRRAFDRYDRQRVGERVVDGLLMTGS